MRSEGWLQLDVYWTAANASSNSEPLQHSLVPKQLTPKPAALDQVRRVTLAKASFPCSSSH